MKPVPEQLQDQGLRMGAGGTLQSLDIEYEENFIEGEGDDGPMLFCAATMKWTTRGGKPMERSKRVVLEFEDEQAMVDAIEEHNMAEAATQEIQAGDWIVASTSVAASGTVDNYLHHIGAQNVRVNAQPGGYRYDFTLTAEEG